MCRLRMAAVSDRASSPNPPSIGESIWATSGLYKAEDEAEDTGLWGGPGETERDPVEPPMIWPDLAFLIICLLEFLKLFQGHMALVMLATFEQCIQDLKIIDLQIAIFQVLRLELKIRLEFFIPGFRFET